ncbi:MAG: heavy-metal-associated domain-containing protein [Bacteroidetes bacterium]|nr:heavy-metal-associated domain-containing protein [Bacteroidota bacterium]
METKQYQFKTNINCGGCVSTVTPYLNNEQGIISWQVDTTNKDKILTVTASGISATEIVTIIEKAGYKATLLN